MRTKRSNNEPGKSMKFRSVMSGPEICRTMQFGENDFSDAGRSLSAPDRKPSECTDGLKMALWALLIRSVTSDFSVTVEPNGTSWVLPSAGLVNRKTTLHSHGEAEWVSWHSVGHLVSCCEMMGTGYFRVHTVCKYRWHGGV